MKIDLDEFSDDNQDPVEEHFEAVVYMPSIYHWPGKHNEVVDLRYVTRYKPMYAYRIMNWMISRHTPNTPYMDTDQFKYLKGRMGSYDNKVKAIKEMFRLRREKREKL